MNGAGHEISLANLDQKAMIFLESALIWVLPYLTSNYLWIKKFQISEESLEAW